MRELNIVNEEEVTVISYDEERGVLTCKVGSTVYKNLIIRRPFPITNPNFLLFINQSSGKIAFTIRDMRRLRDDVRAIVERILNRFYFMPIITRIYSLETSGDELIWDVETDRGGRTRVRTRGGRSSIVSVGSRVVIIDVDDIIYQIPDINRLDKRSRRFIEYLI